MKTYQTEDEVLHLNLYGEEVTFDVNSLKVYRGYKEKGDGGMPNIPLSPISKMRHLVVIPTQACNLKCKYCFVDRTPRDVLSLSYLKKAASFCNKISFFGGEPLLVWKDMERYLETLKSIWKKNLRCHLTTNGTLLDSEKVSKMASVNMSYLVSLDGPRELTDENRGEGVFDRVMSGLRFLRKPNIRATVHGEAPLRLKERAEFFYELEKQGIINAFSIEPAMIGESACEGSCDIEAFSKELHDIAEMTLDRIRNGKRILFFYFRSILHRLVERKPKLAECGAGRGYITLAPDGTLHACHRLGTPIGHIEKGFNEAKRASWIDNRVYSLSKCMECPYRFLCGGPCRQSLGVWEDQCILRKAICKEAIWILAQEGVEECLRK